MPTSLNFDKATIQNMSALSQNPNENIRTAFFISDGTAITAERLGRAILSQFDSVAFETYVIPYVDSVERAMIAVEQINFAYEKSQMLPLVFDTIVNDEIREKINSAQACNLDMYEGLIGRISEVIGVTPDNHSGHAHDNIDSDNYKSRIDAVHFALDNDDGGRTRHYDKADIILIGVSRSGKTPTSLYLAMQFGIRAANYPITEEDLQDNYSNRLPQALKAYKDKLFGLNIDTDRLVKIRQERMADSRYASYKQCEDELRAIKAIYMAHDIPFLDVSEISVEEIATRILQIKGLKRRIV